MRVAIRTVVVFALGALFADQIVPVVQAQFRSVSTTRLFTADLAGWCEGKELTIELNVAEPGSSGPHYHPAHSITYVLEGSETYVLGNEPAKVVTADAVLHEAPMQVHTVGNDAPVRLLAVRIAEKGTPATVRVP